MPFLFNDLILFCISISPLQIEILDKTHLLLPADLLHKRIHRLNNKTIITKNESSHFKIDIFQSIHFNQYSANINDHILNRRHYYTVNSYFLYSFYIFLL